MSNPQSHGKAPERKNQHQSLRPGVGGDLAQQRNALLGIELCGHVVQGIRHRIGYRESFGSLEHLDGSLGVASPVQRDNLPIAEQVVGSGKIHPRIEIEAGLRGQQGLQVPCSLAKVSFTLFKEVRALIVPAHQHVASANPLHQKGLPDGARIILHRRVVQHLLRELLVIHCGPVANYAHHRDDG